MTPTQRPETPTILIIDDTPVNLRVAVEYLEAHGFRVVVAQAGDEGVTRAERVQPELILLDVMMPGIDGLETCRRLKSLPATWDIPVIFMTSLTEAEHKVAGFRAGAVDYVTKPLQIEELMARVRMHLGLYAERKRARALLHKREQEFRALAENSPDAIGRFDRECRLLYANPALGRIMPAALADFAGKTATEIAPTWDGAARFNATLREVVDSGDPIEAEFALCPQEGAASVPVCQIRFVPERDRDGTLVSVLMVGRDITAIREAEHRLAETNAQLRDLSSRRETAREEERKRIAREIHDELGQHLTALRMGISVLRLQFGHDNPLLVERVNALMTLADQAILVVRNVASSLRPGVLNMGLTSALEWLVQEFSRHSGILCHLALPEDPVPLGEDRATAIFRVVQESLTNIARHARAHRAEVRLERHEDGYRLQVSDDGKGFDPAVRRKDAFGLVGMRERALMLGGRLEISSAPGRGTIVSVIIPAHKTTEPQ